MKKVFQIYKQDLLSMFRHPAALIVVVALCIIPSLYAWFNIKASWDPYAQEATSGIKIGVVNLDEGAVLNGEKIDIGQKVIENLKDNHQLGWQFVSQEESERNVKNGEYYASITIPQDFSANLTSILQNDVHKGQIIYTVNEKINAIAPKLTDKGATGLQEQVSKELVETVSKAIFGIANDLGIKIEEQIPKITEIYDLLVKIQGNFGEINQTLNQGLKGTDQVQALIGEIQKDMPKIESTIVQAQGLSIAVQNFVRESEGVITKLGPMVKQDILIIYDVAKQVVQYTNGLKDIIIAGADQAPEILANIILKVDGLKTTTESLVNILKNLNKFTGGKLKPIIEKITEVQQVLETAVQLLTEIKTKVDAGIEIDFTLFDKLVEVGNHVADIAQGLTDQFDTVILPALNQTLSGVFDVASNSLDILKGAQNKIPQAQNILNIAYTSAQKGEKGVAFIKQNLPKVQAIIDDIIATLANIHDEEDLKELVRLLKADVAKRSDFLANPVEIVENKLYPMGNYGTAMTPFYTVLSLWVGLMLLSSILSVETKGDYTKTQVYFGKLLLFLTVSIVQALIVALGDLYLLKITAQNPALFVAGMVFSAVAFTFIVYSLVSVFGNIGKVIGIILLVLQVAGSGGTFPIQLTPHFFQVLNPFLPFTYAISFAREAIGGVVPQVLQKDIMILCVYILVSVLISILFKKTVNRLSEGFVKNFEESGLGE